MTNPDRPLIMSVEDNRDTQQLIERLLTKAGYDVIVADNGVIGLEMLIVQSHRPDLILLDIMMPEMNGYEFCAKLQENENLSYIPVVFLTALGEEQDKSKAFAVGAVDYLTKPIFKNRLLEVVEKQMQTNSKWKQLQEQSKRIRATDYLNFKQFLFDELSLSSEKREKLASVPAAQLYAVISELGITSAQLARHIADHLNLNYLPDLAAADVQLGVLPAPFCKTNSIVAIKNDTGQNQFVLSNPFNLELLDHLNTLTGQQQSSRICITPPDSIVALFNPALSFASSAAASIADAQERFKDRFAPAVPEEPEMVAGASEESEPIIRLVNQFIETAYNMGASDVHIEPWEKEVVVRYRIDGDLRIMNRFGPQTLILPIVARIKIMSSLDIAERRLPQDGRISFKKFTRKPLDFDLRVAITPMQYGEKVVLRILDKQKSTLPLQKLGFSPRNLELYREMIKTPYGMVLHVGPTGSGKSMTLYAALNEIQRPELNIQTAEDPIEYTLPGINQMQMHREIGLTFQRALRAYLRQDPDILLVGEIRDLETGQIAIEAALTGHLLLSTLHTNDSPSSVTRLVEMGIEPFLVSSTVICVVAQRLLRRLCEECKEPYVPDASEKALLGLPPDYQIGIYRPKGCKHCAGIGYKGRIGTHEILLPDDEMRMGISTNRMTAEALKRAAVERGMTTLYWDAMEKVREGVCSIPDVLSKVRRDDFDSRPTWMFEDLDIERPASR
ncbi:MAG TPA: ATPase, T2SS/T4P/T4SS family [Acidobacteriota bacterium]|nr:ATPase, T2SS/T4P/T4SS family [Acidobacteriota bacterium]